MYVELHKFLPHWAETASTEGATSDARLTMLQWVAAWDRYAIAATAAGEMTYASAAAHKDVILQACSCIQWVIGPLR